MADLMTDIGSDAVAPVSTGEQAYDRIRADIVFGRLRPGQRLILEKLRPAYSVGISTLREILSRLTPEGFVTAEGQRGLQVAPCSADDLEEIAALRLLIEKDALARSFQAGDMEWEGRVVASHHKLARLEASLLEHSPVDRPNALDSGFDTFSSRKLVSISLDNGLAGDQSRTQQWKRYDWEFHQALVSACGSKALIDLHSGIYDRYLRYQMVFVIFRGPVAAAEHKALLECALNRDAKKAEAILERHVQGCLDFAFQNRLI